MATITGEATEQAAIDRHIEQNPQRPWEDALMRENAVPVWAIVGYILGTDGDRVKTAEDYEIPVEAVDAALVYYERHRETIDARLAPARMA